MVASPLNPDQLQERIRELSQRQAQADALFNSIGQGVISTDKDGRVNGINQVALDMLGLKEKDIMNKWYPEIVVAEDADSIPIPTLNRPIIKAFLTGKAITEDIFFRHKNGTVIPVNVTVSPIILNKQPVGAVEVFRDISHELEVDLMKSEFIYLASHQLRTPLTAVKTYAHMLHDGYQGALKPGQKAFAKTMLMYLDRMNDIISTLLNISRIEAGKVTLVTTKTCMPEVVEQSIRELQGVISKKDLQVSQSSKIQDTILTDPLLAKEVCLNLLSNAIKYTPEGGKIRVSVSHNTKGQTVRIKDSGYGIPEESQNKLFSKFYRAPNVLNLDESGTGLGLYLVRGLAEALGGKIWFSSQEGKGSTFCFFLPMKPPADEDKA